jgi:hypothetical protein
MLAAAAPQVAAQSPPPQEAPPVQALAPVDKADVSDLPPPLMDVFDLLRLLRHKDKPEQEQPAWDYRNKMVAFAPVIAAKPSSGLIFGAAGNVAFFQGDPKTTHISSAVLSLTFSEKHQTALTGRFTAFTRDDR